MFKPWNIFSVIVGLSLVVLALFATAPATAPVQADGQETCPSGGDWTKIDGLSGYSYTLTAPEGKLVAEWCVKYGTNVDYGNVNPPQASVTITVEGHEISHASFRLVDAPPPTPEPTPEKTPTPEHTPEETLTPEPTPEKTPTPEHTPEETPKPTPTQPSPKVPPTGGGWEGFIGALGILLVIGGFLDPALRAKREK